MITSAMRSLYFLDVPGVCTCTTFSTPLFLFLASMLRPTTALRSFPALLNTSAPSSSPPSRTIPLLDVAKAGTTRTSVRASIALIGAFDANRDVLVVLAHGELLLETVGPEFPASLDGSRERWKERAVWAFLEQGNVAFRFGDKESVGLEVPQCGGLGVRRLSGCTTTIRSSAQETATAFDAPCLPYILPNANEAALAAA
ncbi:hypothetical protein B0H16DRAFT_1891312 [Mycena metata]|nr:hypothetical protein B0H16DRAFT_1891312 [Mycena metata]